MNKEIEIPEGYEARIEGNKVVLELRESEDERIRKDLVNVITWLKANPKLSSQYYHDRYDGMLAWLEKQVDVEAEIEKAYKNADEVQYRKGFEDGVASVKPTEWSEEDIDAIAIFLHDNSEGMLWSTAERLAKGLTEKLFRPQLHWKPSEDQIKALRKAVNKLAYTDVADSVTLSIMYDNLKKL